MQGPPGSRERPSPTPIPDRPAEEPPPELPRVVIRRARKAPQASIGLWFHYRPARVHHGTAMSFLCDLLAAAPHGRLFQALRANSAMAYDQGLAVFGA